jgi:hypothetical protein
MMFAFRDDLLNLLFPFLPFVLMVAVIDGCLMLKLVGVKKAPEPALLGLEIFERWRDRRESFTLAFPAKRALIPLDPSRFYALVDLNLGVNEHLKIDLLAEQC